MIIADVVIEKMRNELKEEFKDELFRLKNVGKTDGPAHEFDLFMKAQIVQFFTINKEIISEDIIKQLLDEEKPLTSLLGIFQDYVSMDSLLYQVFEDFFLYDGENIQDFREQFFFDEDYEDEEEDEETEEDEEKEEIEALQEVLKEKPEHIPVIMSLCDEDDGCEDNEEFQSDEDEGLIHDNEDC